VMKGDAMTDAVMMDTAMKVAVAKKGWFAKMG